MASIRRGYSDDFVLKNGRAGIGSSNPQDTLDVVDGAVKGQDFKTVGVSSFTGYEGFLNSDQTITETVSITGGASLSGEIIVGTGQTVTVTGVGLGTTTVGVGTFGTGYSGGTITNTIETTDINLAGGSEIECLKVYNTFTPPSGGTNGRPYAPKPGELYYNYDFKTIEFFDGYGWRQVDNTTRSGRGLFGGGRVGSTPYNIIDFINIQTLGNAQDFGDMQSKAISPTACSSELRGIFAGGYAPASGLLIDYVTIASAGDALDFGDLTDARRFASATSSSTRGVFMAGRDNPANNAMDVIDYIEIGTLGNALDFGNLATADMRGSAAGDGKRGIYIAGNQSIPSGTSQNQFITIASKGNGTNFGSLQKTRQYTASSANSTRMVIGGGSISTPVHSDSIETYVIQSLGNSVEFGNLTVDRYHFASAATQTRAVWGGGSDGSTDNYNLIEYITISTGGSAIDFGDLTLGRYSCAGCSDSHGGLGGF